MINPIFFYISSTFKIQNIPVYPVNLYLSKDFSWKSFWWKFHVSVLFLISLCYKFLCLKLKIYIFNIHKKSAYKLWLLPKYLLSYFDLSRSGKPSFLLFVNRLTLVSSMGQMAAIKNAVRETSFLIFQTFELTINAYFFD